MLKAPLLVLFVLAAAVLAVACTEISLIHHAPNRQPHH